MLIILKLIFSFRSRKSRPDISSTKWFQKRGHENRDLKVKKLFEDTLILIFKKIEIFYWPKYNLKLETYLEVIN